MGGEMEFLGSYAGEQAEQIKAAEVAADSALTAWQQYTAHIDSERASLKNYNASTKATLTKTKEDLGKKLAAALVEKREMWSTISTIQSDITTSLARASYLEKEGFAVDPENVGALVKMYYKLHSYVTYKLKKGKK